MKTVVGLFDSFEDARSTIADFAGLGLSNRQIGLLASAQSHGAGLSAPDLSFVELPGLGRVAVNGPMLELLDVHQARSGADGALSALLRIGVPRSDAERFVEGIKRGGILEALFIEDDKAGEALAIMSRHTGSGMSRTEQVQEIVIPLVREELSVGKREVDSGSVRIVTRVTQRPVEKTAVIREEHVAVERRIVDHEVDDLDEPFRDRIAEMRASSEEPIITKRAHVVEEVRVHTRRTERVEKVRDTLRQTSADIVEVPAVTSSPAHEFGRELARRSPGHDWVKLEPDAKSLWERKNPGTWERFREAIRGGWRSMTH